MRLIFFTVLSFLLHLSSLEGIVNEIHDFSLIAQQINQMDEQSLVVFDIDNTLMIPKDHILRPCNVVLFNRLFQNFLNNPKIVERNKYPPNYLSSQLILGWNPELIDPTVASLIKEIQDKKIKVIALTNTQTGPFGAIKLMEDLRFIHLFKLGIDFRQAFYKELQLVFPEAAIKGGTFPIYKRGILFTANATKGKVLKAFLKKIHWKPKSLFFIDDNKIFIDSVEKEMKKMGIDVTSFHFKGLELLPCEIDEKIAEFQFDYLVKNGKWIHDQEAKTLLYQIK